jgi:hypothetical protein
MSRDTDLSQILFPVEEKPIFFVNPKAGMKQIPNYKTIVNVTTNEPISVVSTDYRLISNQEALELGEKCFKQLFNEVDIDSMEIFNIITPKSKSFCHIDIIHNKYEVNIWEKEVWLPYIRITNSYNRLKPLRFDLGFCRKLCFNGVIFERNTISYKFYHTIPSRHLTSNT